MKQIMLLALVALTFASCQQTSKQNTAQTADSTIAQPVSAANTTQAQADSVPSSNVTVVSGDAPAISFETVSHDFGKITQGEKVYYSYKFKNVGKTPLIISHAEATCGCTVPEIPKEPIKPGAQGEIKVIFNSAGKSGMQDKVVTITSNAAQPVVQVHLKGEVAVKG